MITIKIKTFKDYKNEFIEWVKEPRRELCKDYVSYYTETVERLIDKKLVAKFEELKFDEDITSKVVDIVYLCISEADKETKELIDSCQPKKLF